MTLDPRKLRPGELCRLLNSTPLGEVITVRQLRRHRNRAGLRVGEDRYVDLLCYVAWLVEIRHGPKPKPDRPAPSPSQLAEAAEGAAALASRHEQPKGHGQKLTHKQEALIAALLTEPTYAAAAAKAGVSRSTLYRRLKTSAFRSAYRRARRELVEAAVGRIQASTGEAAEALVNVIRQGRRDGDRVRAATVLLDQAHRGLASADLLHGEQDTDEQPPLDSSDVVRLLASRLQQLDSSELPTAEKARLTTKLTDALLRALKIEVLDKRLEAIQAVLLDRKERRS
ncbi:MAG: hypothetical protein ABIG44_07935 [Planctomycetota bacterium]